jgi:hypothetical protein
LLFSKGALSTGGEEEERERRREEGEEKREKSSAVAIASVGRRMCEKSTGRRYSELTIARL